MYLNTIYMNIFTFNFTPVSQKDKTQAQVIKENYSAFIDSLSKKLRSEILDSLRIYSTKMQDSINADLDSSLTDSLKTMAATLKNNAKEDSLNRVVREFAEKTKNDTVYTKWAKKTAVLYEAMEPKKAAKIIQNYSDNIARDILYMMKKKKAAEILTNLSPELANRFTRIR